MDQRRGAAVKLLLLILAACAAPPEPKASNTLALCHRAIACDVFEPEQLDPCVACLEHWAAQLNEDIKAAVPPPDHIGCQLLEFIAEHKRIAECVREEWWAR